MLSQFRIKICWCGLDRWPSYMLCQSRQQVCLTPPQRFIRKKYMWLVVWCEYMDYELHVSTAGCTRVFTTCTQRSACLLWYGQLSANSNNYDMTRKWESDTMSPTRSSDVIAILLRWGGLSVVKQVEARILNVIFPIKYFFLIPPNPPLPTLTSPLPPKPLPPPVLRIWWPD